MFKTAIPLSNKQHQGLRFQARKDDYRFAAREQFVPLIASELSKAADFYPIVFPASGGLLPLALLGVRPGQNLHVDGQGHWTAGHVPLSIKRYPFALAEQPAGASTSETQRGFTLCIVPDAPHFASGEGMPLFDEHGKAGPLIEQVQQDLAKVYADAERTQFMVKQLEDAGLLIDAAAPVVYAVDKVLGIRGVRLLNVAHFVQLTPDERAPLEASGAAALAETHLNSLKNLAGGVLGDAANPANRVKWLDPEAVEKEKAAHHPVKPVAPSETGLFGAAGFGAKK